MSKLTTEKVNLFKKFIGTMSYYNAAEGNYSSEGIERRQFKQHVKETIHQWYDEGVTYKELKELYDATRALTNEWEFIDKDLREKAKAKGEYYE